MLVKLLVFCLILVAGPVQALLPLQNWVTANGARVYFVQANDLPIVDVRVVFDAAAARDAALPGLSKFTNALLAEGASGLDADRIAERLADLGVSFEADSLRDMASISLRSLSDSTVLEPAVSLTALILQRPDFPPEALERVRGQLLVAIRQERQSPQSLAERAFYKAVYNGHPYALPPNGVEESVKAISRRDIEAFYARYYVGKNCVVAIVGDLNRSAAEKLAKTLVGGLPEGQPAPRLPKVSRLEAARQEYIDYPSAQTHILVGQPGIRRRDEDFYALYVGNHILGGSGLVSLLSGELRERRGLVYSVSTYFLPMHAKGPFITGLQTRHDKADDALKVLRATLNRFLEDGPTEEQLAVAQKNITGGFPLRIDSNEKILSHLAMIGFYDLPRDYLLRFNERVQEVSTEAIREAFARRVVQDRLVTVVVGPSARKARSEAPKPPVPAVGQYNEGNPLAPALPRYNVTLP